MMHVPTVHRQAPRPEETSLEPSFRLVLVSPYPRLAVLTESLSVEYNCRVSTIAAVLDEVHSIDFDALPVRPDVLLSRGGTAEHLRATIQDIPVLSINTSALDLLGALQPMATTVRTVVFANYGRRLDGVQDVARALSIEITEVVYNSHEELVGQILLAAGQGADLTVGGQLVVRESQAAGIPSILLEAGEHAVREALREASSVAQMNRWLNQRNAYLKTILNNIAEGVIVTDEHDVIRVINATAERLLETPAAVALGAPIATIIPDSAVPAIRTRAQSEFGELLQAGSRTLVANRVPIFSGETVVGVVCTVADGSRIQRAEQRLRSQMRQKGFVARYDFDSILTEDPGMQELKRLAAIYARGRSSVLLEGETGTGKELFAHAIHRASPFADGPFVAVNCAAIPEALLESELFGYEEGAFTGARRQGKAGLFEIAHHGTIFLDEIGEIPGALQARLLRVLQQHEVMRIGGNQIVPIEVRVVSATNRDLAQRVREGHFREDLFYRLNVLTLRIPPLRERRKDIRFIGLRFLQDQLRKKRIEPSLEDHLVPLMNAYAWPGNLRELQNTMERLALVAETCPDLPWPKVVDQIWSPFEGGQDFGRSSGLTLVVTPSGGFKDMCRQAETQIISHYMALHDGDQTRAAADLGISRMSLWRRLQGGGD